MALYISICNPTRRQGNVLNAEISSGTFVRFLFTQPCNPVVKPYLRAAKSNWDHLDRYDTRAQLVDIFVTISKENWLPFGQFPRSSSEIGSKFLQSQPHNSTREECNFDVQGSHESFAFELMHSHSEEMHIHKQHFQSRICNFVHRYDWSRKKTSRKTE